MCLFESLYIYMNDCLENYVVRVLHMRGLFTPHAQRERGKVIGRGVHIYICLWSKKKN